MAKFVSLTILCLAVFGTQIHAFEFWDDLRVTWGVSPITAYHRLPRNTVDATSEGWTQVSTTCENGGLFSGFQWTHPTDDGVALLFDTKGFVAGIQSMVPQRELLVPGTKINYSNVPMYRNYTVNGQTYFAITAYFINPTRICSGGLGNGNIGAESAIYFQNGPTDNHLKVAYKNRTEAIANGWTRNSCVPGMGQHNFFEVEKYDPTDCSEPQPTCILYDKYDQMHGFCLTYAGLSSSRRFEHPDSAGIQAVMGVAPKCLLDQTDLIGATTIHVYFHNNPWLIGC